MPYKQGATGSSPVAPTKQALCLQVFKRIPKSPGGFSISSKADCLRQSPFSTHLPKHINVATMALVKPYSGESE